MSKKKKERRFFTIRPCKGCKFIDPCRRCLVKACCTRKCEKRINYNRTYSLKQSLLIGVIFYSVMGGSGFVLGGLFFSGHYIIGTIGLITLYALWFHLMVLIEE